MSLGCSRRAASESGHLTLTIPRFLVVPLRNDYIEKHYIEKHYIEKHYIEKFR